jgi:hypothetical protein
MLACQRAYAPGVQDQCHALARLPGAVPASRQDGIGPVPDGPQLVVQRGDDFIRYEPGGFSLFLWKTCPFIVAGSATPGRMAQIARL